MVTLFVSDFDQVTMLGWLLEKNNIPYEVSFNKIDNGLTPPYINVDGVPLDFCRAIKWIEERDKNDRDGI